MDRYKTFMNSICPVEVDGLTGAKKLIFFSILDKIILSRDTKYNGFKINNKKYIMYSDIELPKIDYSYIKKSLIAKDIIKDSMIEFSRVMRRNNKKAYNNYCINSKGIYLTDNDPFHFPLNTLGYFGIDANVKHLDKKGKSVIDKNMLYIKTMSLGKVRDATRHELMHMVSTEPNTSECGFIRVDDNSDSEIGRFLNEGCTDLMCEEYFPGYQPGYPKYIIDCARAVRNIVGKEKFDTLFFNADLNGLINELSSYSNKKETIQFITNLDDIGYINSKIHKGGILKPRERTIKKELLVECSKYIKNCIETKRIYNIACKK